MSMSGQNEARRWRVKLAVIAATAALGACGGGGNAAFISGGGGNGTLRLALTDAPACGYDHVYVTVQKVRVHQSSSAQDADAGWSEVTVSPAKRIDLLALNNGGLEELGSTSLTAGHYSQIRLVLADNSGAGTNSLANAIQPTGGALTALGTPSAQQSGLKLKADFDVAAGQTADLVLDFDACKSVVKASNSGQFILKPVVSVLPRVDTGIKGFVATTLPLASTTVSVQQNGATVRSAAPDATGGFNIPFLAAGNYSVVVTADGHATGVITSVPAGTGTTVVGGTSTAAITLPASAMAQVAGTVSATSVQGNATVTTVLTDASVRATQALTGGPTIEVAGKAVDAVLGTYALRLPVAAPVKAAYAAGALSLAPDTAVAGKYTIEATAPGRIALDKPADISAGPATVDFSY
jgi:hypothetical protein